MVVWGGAFQTEGKAYEKAQGQGSIWPVEDAKEAKRPAKESKRDGDRSERELRLAHRDFVDQSKEFAWKMRSFLGRREASGDVRVEVCHALNYVIKESFWLLCGEETRRPGTEARG